jgi:hypothetical protein
MKRIKLKHFINSIPETASDFVVQFQNKKPTNIFYFHILKIKGIKIRHNQSSDKKPITAFKDGIASYLKPEMA